MFHYLQLGIIIIPLSLFMPSLEIPLDLLVAVSSPLLFTSDLYNAVINGRNGCKWEFGDPACVFEGINN